MFVAQLSSVNSCTIPEGIDVEYPNPGTQVERVEGKLGAPVGDCGSSSGGGAPPAAMILSALDAEGGPTATTKAARRSLSPFA